MKFPTETSPRMIAEVTLPATGLGLPEIIGRRVAKNDCTSRNAAVPAPSTYGFLAM